ncbi:MAG TPA: ABC transporter ATP-binding protein, partial [Chloroflexota bacterium]|nr:ABC transporter ATP-binding protein [Chloroflexota bacterium]
MRATRRLAIFLRPYRSWAILAPLLMVLEVTMDLTQPRLLQQIVDQGISQSNMAVVIQTGLLMVGCAVVGMGGGVG